MNILADIDFPKGKKGGYAYYDTEWGRMLIGFIDEYLAGLFFCIEEGQDVLSRLKRQWPCVGWMQADGNTSNIDKQIESYVYGGVVPDLSVIVSGTPFQLSVWRHLANVQRGEVVSYTTLAEAIQKPRAVRAVGTAVGLNPVSVLIPCHRVIQKSGKIGDYAWGSDIKRRLLNSEGALLSNGLAPGSSFP